jgi:transketolase
MLELANHMHLTTGRNSPGELSSVVGPVLTGRVPPRNKQIHYDAAALLRLDRNKEYSSGDIVTAAMKVFARDSAVVSIDSDLATTSGLEAAVAAVDQTRALNVGVAEANMCVLARRSPRWVITPGSARSVRSTTGKCYGE